MDKIAAVVVVCLLVVSLVACLTMVAPILQTEAKTRQTQAETQQVEANAELTEAETELTQVKTSQESQRTLSEVVSELMTELRAERVRFDQLQREQWQLLIELAEERSRPRYTWVWVLLIIIGGIVIALLLRRRERIVILLPLEYTLGSWLPIGSTGLAPWQEPGAVQIAQVSQERQEITIE